MTPHVRFNTDTETRMMTKCCLFILFLFIMIGFILLLGYVLKFFDLPK